MVKESVEWHSLSFLRHEFSDLGLDDSCPDDYINYGGMHFGISINERSQNLLQLKEDFLKQYTAEALIARVKTKIILENTHEKSNGIDQELSRWMGEIYLEKHPDVENDPDFDISMHVFENYYTLQANSKYEINEDGVALMLEKLGLICKQS